MKKILVLGIGNRLMKDDGIGIYVVEQLSRQNNMEDFEFMVGETDIDFCLSVIREASDKDIIIVIIDAVISGKQPGDILVLEIDELTGSRGGISLHNQTLLDCISNFGMEIKGFLIGIEPFDICYHFDLSPVLKKRLAEICDHVTGLLQLVVE